MTENKRLAAILDGITASLMGIITLMAAGCIYYGIWKILERWWIDYAP